MPAVFFAIWDDFESHMDLRFCMFNAGCHMDLRFCMCERRANPNVIWTYVCAYRSAGGHMDLRFCMSERRAESDGDMDLRLCMFQRRRSYGLTFMHV